MSGSRKSVGGKTLGWNGVALSHSSSSPSSGKRSAMLPKCSSEADVDDEEEDEEEEEEEELPR